jgi:hypothetical protein
MDLGADVSTNVADIFRWVTILLGISILNTNAVLYWRIYRFSLPIWTARLILVSASIITLFSMLVITDHFGTGLTWRTPVLFIAFSAHELGLILYYRWTRRPEGRRYRHHMRAEFYAARALRREGLQP